MAAIVACFVALLLPNMASPIFPLWQEDLGFSPGVINLLFAVYPVGVLTSLFGTMRLLRHFSWRVALLASVATGLVSALLLVAADGPVVLGIGRYVCGVSVGIVLSVGAATITAALEHRGVRAAPRIAAIIISAGFASGPLLAGVVADRAPHPTTLVFEIEAVGLVLVFVYLLLDPGLRAADGYHRPRGDVEEAGAPVHRMLPVGHRRAALRTATWIFVSCSISCATFQSLGSSYLKGLLGTDSATFSGLLVFLVFGSAFTGQLALSGTTSRVQGWTALAAGGTGAALLVTGVLTDSVPALFAAAALSGAAQGLGQSTGFTLARQTTDLDRLPGVLSRLNVASYGLAGGSILVTSPVVDAAGVGTAILGIAAAVLGLVAVAVAVMARSHRTFVLPAVGVPTAPAGHVVPQT